MIEISQEFGFDAAHYLGNGAPENRRLHGHSFYAEVTLRGEPDPATGFLRDFGQVDRAQGHSRNTRPPAVERDRGVGRADPREPGPVYICAGQGGFAGSRAGQSAQAVLWPDLRV